MILTAAAYGMLQVLSEGLYYTIFAAVIGIVIGFTMQFLGKGIETKFALLASA